MTPIRYWQEQLREVHLDIEAARKDHSWQALASLRRQAKDLRLEMDKTAKKQAETSEEGFDKLPLDQQAVLLKEAMLKWPDQFLELAVSVMEQRHAGRWRLIRVIEGQGDDGGAADEAV